MTEGRESSGLAAGARVSHRGRRASFLLWGDQVVGGAGGALPGSRMDGGIPAGDIDSWWKAARGREGDDPPASACQGARLNGNCRMAGGDRFQDRAVTGM